MKKLAESSWEPRTLKNQILPAVGGQHNAVSGMWCAVQLYNDILTTFKPWDSTL
jgi:hypothetical protein